MLNNRKNIVRLSFSVLLDNHLPPLIKLPEFTNLGWFLFRLDEVMKKTNDTIGLHRFPNDYIVEIINHLFDEHLECMVDRYNDIVIHGKSN